MIRAPRLDSLTWPRPRSVWTRVMLCGALALPSLLGCGAEIGATCALDSDCQSGLICDFDQTCKTPEAVSAALFPADTAAPTPAVPGPADANAADASPVPDGIGPTPTCATDPGTRRVTSVEIVPTGTGLGKLATLANPVIAKGFDQIDIVLGLPPGGACPGDCVWFAGNETPCGALYTDTFPFRIPGPIGTGIVALQNFTFDAQTGTLTAMVSEADILAAVAKSLHDAVDIAIDADLDTDQDGIPDMVSATLILGLDG